MASWLAAFAGVLLLYTIVFCFVFLPSPFQPGSKYAEKNQIVCILVLGDIGRSPRMQYHAASLSRLGFKVQIVGYKGTRPHESIFSDTNITYHFVPGVPIALGNIPFILAAPLKVLHQLFFLVLILGYSVDPPAYMLVQNPPSIPSLLVARLVCWLRNTKLIIDWHNFGWSVLAVKIGANHILVQIAKAYERIVARAHSHFCVTAAMADVLRKDHILARVLYDRPPSQFQALDPRERSRVRDRYGVGEKEPLLVSSTSWTEDEDFSILLDALRYYKGPSLRVIVTGKGPMLEHYKRQMGDMKKTNVTIETAWLAAEDYPKLLASADLGVSLHTSTSGVDLPMKVLDMFGCGLPVLAKRFEALDELIKEGVNGRIFDDAEDLTQMLEGLLGEHRQHLDELRKGALAEGDTRWDDSWNNVARDIFKHR
ncbi:mannosyltransferase [Savitreella phatthalungensis]